MDSIHSNLCRNLNSNLREYLGYNFRSNTAHDSYWGIVDTLTFTLHLAFAWNRSRREERAQHQRRTELHDRSTRS